MSCMAAVEQNRTEMDFGADLEDVFGLVEFVDLMDDDNGGIAGDDLDDVYDLVELAGEELVAERRQYKMMPLFEINKYKFKRISK